MFLITGLGNPGQQYAKTRHNIGWFVLDELARRHNLEFVKKNGDYKTAAGTIGEDKIVLVKPQTYMNLSGKAVAALKHYYRVEPENIIVITDDLNLPLGKLRLKASGSDGGHNGLKSVAQMLGGTNYPRLRIGVGEPAREEREASGTAGFVLRPFTSDEWPAVDEATAKAADCVELWIKQDIQAAMNLFNR